MNAYGQTLRRGLAWAAFVTLSGRLLCAQVAQAPDKLVVLTFDDAKASQFSVVRPLLKAHGFSATFFISEGFTFPTNKQDYLTWEQIAQLHRDGFEIGNHTRDHLGVNARNLDHLTAQLEAINVQCAAHGIPRPVSFAYPGNAITPGAIPILERLGIRFARRGGSPEYPYAGGRGYAFEPGGDHPLLIPSAGDARPDWALDDLKRAVHQARQGRVAVLQFHGVPDQEHPWVNTPPERFGQYLDYLQRNGYRVVALRDLAPYIDRRQLPSDPTAIIHRRQLQGPPKAVVVRGELVDGDSHAPLPGRLYIRDAKGGWHFPDSAASTGTALTYQARNWLNPRAIEMHTTLSPHPFELELPPGRYTFTAEHGKEYLPAQQEVTVGDQPVEVRLPLRHWIDLAARGWYSGDVHAHRAPAELANVILAEDVNVAFPMVYWTTDATIPPTRGNKNIRGDFRAAPTTLDALHVCYPQNTEYEIFSVGGRSHTVGAVLAINHRTVFDQTAPPVAWLGERARAEGALLDLEKHNWPWSMALVPLVHPDLFELANNHHWETEFSVTSWAVSAPAWMHLGSGSGNEREWTLYGFATYYALLDCGFRLQPAAGTAHGVHPVPLGFSRVYVHLPQGFGYAAWVEGLKQGHSFVTTGPMLFATVDGADPGGAFQTPIPETGKKVYRLDGEFASTEPAGLVEIIANGEVVQTIHPVLTRTPAGGYSGSFKAELAFEHSGWLAVRCWEEHTGGRFRFAHTAPWFVEMAGRPLRPRQEEAEFLVHRVEEEIDRSRNVLSAESLAEYRRALAAYQAILSSKIHRR